jgi:hypothetical protein
MMLKEAKKEAPTQNPAGRSAKGVRIRDLLARWLI